MRRTAPVVTCLLLLLLGLAGPPARAQATLAFVSGVGDNSNPCSRTAPCQTFSGALARVAAGGEINCIDPGNFGSVTITKSITISCETIGPNVLTSGITISGSGITVYLRGIDFEGLGLSSQSPGANGLSITNAAAVTVTQCRFHAFGTYGISVTTASNLVLSVTDSVVADNGSRTVGGTGGGIDIAPTGAGITSVALQNVRLVNNSFGFKADSTNASGAIKTAITDSLVNGNTNAGIASFTGNAQVVTMVNRTRVSNNGVAGIRASGGKASLVAGSSVVTGNGFANNGSGVSAVNGGTVSSYQNNQINGNANNGTPAPTTPLN